MLAECQMKTNLQTCSQNVFSRGHRADGMSEAKTSAPTMTNDGKTSSPFLTEEVYCPGHASPWLRAKPEEFYAGAKNRDSEYWHRQVSRWCTMADVAEALGCQHCHNHYLWTLIPFCEEREWEAETRQYAVKQKSEAQAKLKEELGPREFTLTYSPSWFESDTDAQNAMRCAIDRLTRYYKDEIIEFHAIGEFTTAGCAHVHAYYHLTGGRKITDKNFKRAYAHWNPKKKLGKGHEGGHHASVRRVSDFAGYTEKHLEEAWMNIHINNADPVSSPS